MSNTTINQLPAASNPNQNYVLAADNSSLTVTEKVTLKQVVDLSRTFSVFNLGSVSGNRAIDFTPDRLVQTLSLNGTATTFTKGTGWPSLSTSGADVVLDITVTNPTTITWSIVNAWIVAPPAGAFGNGKHIILLRAIGSTIQGYYVNSN